MTNAVQELTSLAPVLGFGVGLTIGLVVLVIVIVAIVVAFLALAGKATVAPVHDQRPFHICPGCSAYNTKVERSCWRCEHDLSQSAIEPHGELGHRLDKLEGKDKAGV